MNVLIIYCHPSKDSLTYKVFEELKNGLEEANHNVVVSDLYEMDFKSDMTIEEYKREGYADVRIPVSKDVKIEHEKIQKSDCIIFVYPVWWTDCPSKLKGWFDRVYSAGFAYPVSRDFPPEMKQQKLGLVICTAGNSNESLEESGLAESMRKIMLVDRLGKRYDNKEMVIFGGTIASKTEKFLTEANSIGKSLEDYIK